MVDVSDNAKISNLLLVHFVARQSIMMGRRSASSKGLMFFLTVALVIGVPIAGLAILTWMVSRLLGRR